jgi:penicillin-binding protein 2
MANRVTLKDDYLESQLMRRRAIVAGALILALITLLASRLYFLQVSSHEHYSTLSMNNRVRLTAVPPPRGLIYDRNGAVLADNLPTYQLEVTPEEVPDMGATLAGLQQVIVLDDPDIQRFKDALKRQRPFEGVPLRFNLTDTEVARFAVNRHRFPGVDIAARLTRYYPLAATTAHVLGYVGRIDEDDLRRVDAADYAGTSHIGKLGVERYYEDRLHGTVGHQQIEVNAEGRVLRVLEEEPPGPGQDIVLSLDAGLQAVAEQAFEGESGALVAMVPETGEVLALVSTPSYDPNLFVNGISSKDYQALRRSPSRPLFNRALSGQYPPGSTIKPLLGLAGLEFGTVSADHKVFCPGHYSLPNHSHRYRDWKREGHGWVDLDLAVVRSCDVYFYNLAHDLGIDRMHEFMARFGFGVRTGLDSTGERSGLLPSPEWKRRARREPWFPGETLITGIGQGAFNVTPIQLSAATATLALKGLHVRPHLLKAVLGPDGTVIEETAPEVINRVELTHAEHWDVTLLSMFHTVNTPRGTAYKVGEGAAYDIAGKTGTAQVFGIAQDEEYDEEAIAKKLRDHALFVAYAPFENPVIALAVIVENGGSGGAVAGPIARKVLDYYLGATSS